MSSHSNVGRVLTLVVEITDDDESEWMWDNINGKKCYGIDIFCIQDGNAVKDLERLEEEDVE